VTSRNIFIFKFLVDFMTYNFLYWRVENPNLDESLILLVWLIPGLLCPGPFHVNSDLPIEVLFVGSRVFLGLHYFVTFFFLTGDLVSCLGMSRCLECFSTWLWVFGLKAFAFEDFFTLLRFCPISDFLLKL